MLAVPLALTAKALWGRRCSHHVGIRGTVNDGGGIAAQTTRHYRGAL